MKDYIVKQNPGGILKTRNTKGLKIKAVTKECLIYSNYKKALVAIIIPDS